MIILLSLFVILTTIYINPASSSGCSRLPRDIYSQSSQPELMRIPREDHPEPEAILWGNPCNYPDGIKPSPTEEDNRSLREIALAVDLKVNHAKEGLKKYKDSFAKAIYGAQNFKKLRKEHRHEKWLRKMPWITDDVLPKHKRLGKSISYDEIKSGMMTRQDTALPKLHKATKMVLAGLRMVSFYGVCNDAIIADGQLRPNLDRSTRDVQIALCQFTKYLEKRGLDSEWMYKLEEPNLYNPNISFLIYRDTMNYLEYLDDVFDMLL